MTLSDVAASLKISHWLVLKQSTGAEFASDGQIITSDHWIFLLFSGFISQCEYNSQVVRVTTMGEGSGSVRVLDFCIHCLMCSLPLLQSSHVGRIWAEQM